MHTHQTNAASTSLVTSDHQSFPFFSIGEDDQRRLIFAAGILNYRVKVVVWFTTKTFNRSKSSDYRELERNPVVGVKISKPCAA